MSASSTDYFKKGLNNFSTTLNGAIGSTDTTIALTSVTNLPTDTGIVLVIDRVDSSGNTTPSLREYVRGTISSNNLVCASTSDRGVGHSTAQAHSSGAVVELVWDDTQQNALATGILVEHNQNGTHGAITSTGATLTTPTITQPTIHTYDGWISATETWTYASADSTNKTYTFTISGVDKTGILSAGDRIKLTQTTVKYFIVTAVSFSTNTTVTIYGGTDYTLANATITSPNYSHQKSPNGFPMDPTKWDVLVSDSSDRAATSSTPANIGSVSINVPIGAWELSHQGTLYTSRSSTVSSGKTTLSAATTTEDDSSMTTECYTQGVSGSLQARTPFFKKKTVILATATPYYQNVWYVNGTDCRVLGSTTGPTIIRATNKYL